MSQKTPSPSRQFSGLFFWLGFGVCPLLTWLCVGLCVLLYQWAIHRIPSGAVLIPHLWMIGLLLFVLFWACVAGFAGFAASFLWNEHQLDNVWGAALGSVLLTWLPCLFSGVPAVLVLGFWPFLFFIGLYSWGVEKGHQFWRSHHPRQWIGDFSDLGPREDR